MIPVRLRLTDFLSYKDMPEPLSFDGIGLACLTGANGHGKSSLLDAITWALWGKARGAEGGHDQERLIRDGAESARVEYEFALDGQRYRVVRERSRTGRASLEFSVATPDGGWTDLTGEGLRHTQDKIERRIRMDYETFVASAFIVQGRADTFTRLEPAQRKQVLGRILGIEIYDRFAERARDRKKECTTEAQAVESVVEGFDRDLETLPGVEAGAAKAEADVTAAAEAAASAADAHEKAQAEAARLEAAGKAADEARARADAAVARLTETEKEIAALAARIVSLEREAVADPALAARAAGRDGLRERVRALEASRKRHDELLAESRDLRARIEADRVRIQAQRDQTAKTLTQQQSEIAEEPAHAKALADARVRDAELAAAAERLETLAAEATGAGERRATLKAEKTRRDADVADLDEKVHLLGGAEAACPLCGDELTPEHRDEILAGMTARRAELVEQDRAAGAEHRSLVELETRIKGEIAKLRTQVAGRGKVAGEIARAEEALARIAKAREAAAETTAILANLDGALARDDYAATEREKLRSIDADIAGIGFDAGVLDAARADLESADAAAEAVAKAAQAAARLEETRTSHEAAGARLATSAAERDAAHRAATEAAAAAAGLQQARDLLTAAAGRLAAAREAETKARARSATLQATVERLRALGVQAAEHRARAAETRKRARLYDKLAKAFGRDGIPARIIGNAVPELAREANELLNLLSDGRLAVSIDTVTRTKSGRDRESLEVTIVDDGQPRPYEMYSGGERLRIDFALRVALSRLLVHRAGARLETLVIDEGFGSQDADGRARLIEAVHRVRGLFALILVMTHLDDVREQFPVRIEVNKDPVHGSRITVV